MSAIGTVGIVGLGAAGGFALAGLRGIPGARCVVGVDLRGTRATSAGKLEDRVSDQLEALERVAPLDLVIVSTPTPDHPKTTVTILWGTHPPARLWIDKPMAVTRDVMRISAKLPVAQKSGFCSTLRLRPKFCGPPSA